MHASVVELPLLSLMPHQHPIVAREYVLCYRLKDDKVRLLCSLRNLSYHSCKVAALLTHPRLLIASLHY
jgi:hypothetical protein